MFHVPLDGKEVEDKRKQKNHADLAVIEEFKLVSFSKGNSKKKSFKNFL